MTTRGGCSGPDTEYCAVLSSACRDCALEMNEAWSISNTSGGVIGSLLVQVSDILQNLWKQPHQLSNVKLLAIALFDLREDE